MACGSESKLSKILAPLLDSYLLWLHFRRMEFGSDPLRERLDEDAKTSAQRNPVPWKLQVQKEKTKKALATLLIDVRKNAKNSSTWKRTKGMPSSSISIDYCAVGRLHVP
jgi:hypothetical protein